MSELDYSVISESIGAILGTSLSENTAYVRFIRNGEFEHPNKTHNVRYCVCCIYTSEFTEPIIGPFVYDIYPKEANPKSKTLSDIMYIIKYQILVLMRLFQTVVDLSFSKEQRSRISEIVYTFMFGKRLGDCVRNIEIEEVGDASQYELITDEEVLNSTQFYFEDECVFKPKDINITKVKDVRISKTVTIHQATIYLGDLKLPKIIMCTTTYPVSHDGSECKDLLNYHIIIQILTICKLINSTFNAIVNNRSLGFLETGLCLRDALLLSFVTRINLVMFDCFVLESITKGKNRLLNVFRDMLRCESPNYLYTGKAVDYCESQECRLPITYESYKYDLRIVNPND